MSVHLQDVGGQSPRQATVFLWKEQGIIDFWHPWPEGPVGPSPQAGASMDPSLLLGLLPRGLFGGPSRL